jgi:hypothetical protein
MALLIGETAVTKGKDKRWYDKHPRLRGYLDSFKEMPQRPRNSLIRGIMGLVSKSNPELVDKFVLNFQLDPNRRRWYDRDPYLWLMFNGLSRANTSLLQSVTSFLSEKAVRGN